jgi:hypothetical protein
MDGSKQHTNKNLSIDTYKNESKHINYTVTGHNQANLE